MSTQIVRCAACKRKLTSTTARAAGYGPMCFRKLFGKAISQGVKERKKRSAIKQNTVAQSEGQISVFDLLEATSNAQEHG